MKKVFNVFMGIIIFGALLVAGVLISARKMLSPSNMTNMLNIVAKDEGGYDKFTDVMFDEMDNDFSEYVDEKELEKAISKYFSSYFQVVGGARDEMDSEDLVKVLEKAADEYSEDHDGEKVSKSEIKDAVKALEQDMDKELKTEKEVKQLLEFVYSNALVISIVVVIIALVLIYVVSKSLDKVFFHLGLNAIITGILTTLAAGALGKALESETTEKVAELLNENLVGNIRTIGIIGLVVGIVCIVVSVLLKNRGVKTAPAPAISEPTPEPEYVTKDLVPDAESEDTSANDNSDI